MNIFTARNKLLRQDASAVASEETPTKKGRGYAALGTLQRTSLAIRISATAVVALNVVTPSAFGRASSSSDIAGKETDSTGATIPGAIPRPATSCVWRWRASRLQRFLHVEANNVTT
jgi:hypothetical protein